jgi:hypothetical protein
MESLLLISRLVVSQTLVSLGVCDNEALAVVMTGTSVTIEEV